jgi:hypothetical protein
MDARGVGALPELRDAPLDDSGATSQKRLSAKTAVLLEQVTVTRRWNRSPATVGRMGVTVAKSSLAERVRVSRQAVAMARRHPLDGQELGLLARQAVLAYSRTRTLPRQHRPDCD